MRAREGDMRGGWGVLVAVLAVGGGAHAQAQEQRRLELLGQTPREQQRAAANQAFLQGWLRRAALLYLHRLDGLTCRELFSLGEEPRFLAAIGNGDGSDHNLVFLEGAGSPSHLDSGPYVFPADTFRAYWPASEDKSTWWHEVNHALLDEAGVGVAPAGHGGSLDNAGEAEGAGARFRATSDDHHVLIEGVGQRGAEAYFELLAFERAVRHADAAESKAMAEGRDVTEYGVQRQLWGDAHQRFSAFTQKMKRVANLAPGDVAAYRQATGVFFTPVTAVAEWYRRGGLKRQERGEVTGIQVPGWVFYPDLLAMPVQLLLEDGKGQDLELPGTNPSATATVKDDVYRFSFRVRVRARGSLGRRTGHAAQDRELGAAVARGSLRLHLVDDDDEAGLTVTTARGPVEGSAGPGGPSVRLFDVGLAPGGVLPVQVTFTRLKVSQLKKPTTLKVRLTYDDPGAERRFDSASAQVAITLGGAAGATPSATGAPTPRPTAPALPPPTPGTAAAKRERKPSGFTVTWGPVPPGFEGALGFLHDDGNPRIAGQGSLPLLVGATMHFVKGRWTEDGTVFELYGQERKEPLDTLADYIEAMRPKDPKQQGWFNGFKQSETTLAGYKAYTSVLDRGGKQLNRHYLVVLDAKRGLVASILTDTYPGKGTVEDKVRLDADIQALVKTLRFTPDGPGAGVAVSRSPDKPVPTALTDAPVAEEQVDPRPPPQPPQVVRKPRRPGAAPLPAPGPTLPPGIEPLPPAGASGGRAGTSPAPAPAPAPGPITAPPGQPASAGGTRPTPPPAPPPTGRAPSPTPSPPSAVPADPNAPLGGSVQVTLNGANTAISVTNTSKQVWHDCLFVLPRGLAFRQRQLSPGDTREVLWRYFKPTPEAPQVVGQVLVQCKEGSLRQPAAL